MLSQTVWEQAQAATLRHIGRGGLDEEAGVASGSGGLPELGRREAENVSTVDIVRQPSEAEQVLRMLPGQLRSLKHLPPRAGLHLFNHPPDAVRMSFCQGCLTPSVRPVGVDPVLETPRQAAHRLHTLIHTHTWKIEQSAIARQ